MAKEIKIELVIDEEQLMEIFENMEVKYKKKYLKEIQEMIEQDTSPFDEIMEEIIQEIIGDNYEQ
jgi:hypothetical protein